MGSFGDTRMVGRTAKCFLGLGFDFCRNSAAELFSTGGFYVEKNKFQSLPTFSITGLSCPCSLSEFHLSDSFKIESSVVARKEWSLNLPPEGWSSRGGATWGRRKPGRGRGWRRRWQRWAAASSAWSAGRRPRPPSQTSQCCREEASAFPSLWKLKWTN